jgi:hypothetical protein
MQRRCYGAHPRVPRRLPGWMALFARGWRVYRYEQLRDTSHLENLTMQSLTLTGAAMLAAALLTGCGAESGPTAENVPPLTADATLTADHSSSIIPLDEIFVSPCNGETIHLTGTLRAEDTFVGTSDGFLHHELQVVVSETGTGLTTGATYRSHDVNHEGFNSPTPEAPNLTFTYNETFYFISTTPALSFRGQFAFHFVALPSGDFKITRDFGSLACQG